MALAGKWGELDALAVDRPAEALALAIGALRAGEPEPWMGFAAASRACRILGEYDHACAWLAAASDAAPHCEFAAADLSLRRLVLRRDQCRLPEALRLADRLLSGPLERTMELAVRLQRAATLWLLRDRRALVDVEVLIACDERQYRAPGRQLLVIILAELGETAALPEALAAARGEFPGTPPPAAQLRISWLEGVAAHALGDLARARHQLASAVRGFNHRKMYVVAALAGLDLVAVEIDRGRGDMALGQLLPLLSRWRDSPVARPLLAIWRASAKRKLERSHVLAARRALELWGPRLEIGR